MGYYTSGFDRMSDSVCALFLGQYASEAHFACVALHCFMYTP